MRRRLAYARRDTNPEAFNQVVKCLTAKERKNYSLAIKQHVAISTTKDTSKHTTPPRIKNSGQCGVGTRIPRGRRMTAFRAGTKCATTVIRPMLTRASTKAKTRSAME
jgi:hypothetical protein